MLFSSQKYVSQLQEVSASNKAYKKWLVIKNNNNDILYKTITVQLLEIGILD